jgi:predicted flap endonuclease-1-like 5' DNA nuclease
MYRADAEKLGLIQPQTGKKQQPQPPNKMQQPEEDKAVSEPKEPEPKPQADDFTEIDGVGQATARALVAHGITSFEQLRDADLTFLPEKTAQAIVDWHTEKYG